MPFTKYYSDVTSYGRSRGPCLYGLAVAPDFLASVSLDDRAEKRLY